MEQEQGTQSKKVWESVTNYAVRCSNCLKWRLIPTKAKYEEIRAKMGEELFQCETAREWRPQITCGDESDVEQDESFKWAMDRPMIPQTPRGWQRILRIRAEGGTKFADVYYVSPSNKRLRSMVELNRYLDEHPRYQQEGINMSRFSFQPPVPLDEKYIAKRRACNEFCFSGNANQQEQDGDGQFQMVKLPYYPRLRSSILSQGPCYVY